MRSYIIQGKAYKYADLMQQCQLMQVDKTIASWEKDIWSFIQVCVNDDIASFDAETSGSTGFPKKIHIRKDYAVASAQKTIAFFHLQPHSKLHLCMHAKYIGAKMMIHRALACGMELTYSEPTMDALAAIDHHVDFCACVPLQLIDLLNKNPQGNPLIACLIIGGAPLDQVWKSRLIQHQTQYYQTFGMTETISHIALLHLNAAQTSYTLLPGIQISTDERSCMVIDAADIGVHHLQTNDIIQAVGTNEFIWKGRADNIINSGGVKLYPEEIEAKIAHLFDSAFFVAGVPDVKLGEHLVLIVEASTRVKSSDEILLSLKSLLDKYQVPKEVVLLARFIYTETNKINRKDTLRLIPS